MEYNTARAELKIPEYGRNIQELADHIKTLATKEERTKAANTLINIMTLLNPGLKEQSEFKHKLWDHLFMIANYDLDIDAPYAMPLRREELPDPEKPTYSSNHIRFRFYGKNVERMLQRASEMEEGPARDAFVNALASYMKMAYRVWNEDKVPDEIIIEHIRSMSKGVLDVKEIREMAAHNENFVPQKQKKDHGGNKKNHFQNKNNNNNNNNQRKNNFRKN